jgi:uptake hydrogenase large subunit
MTIEGKLSINIFRQDGHIANVDIQSSRPLKAVNVLQGKKVKEALDLLPRLFSICATAQAGASIRACQQAFGLSPDPAIEAAHDILILMEVAREHLWRIALGWPKILGEPISASWASSLSAILTDTKSALFTGSTAFTLQPELKFDTALLHEQFFRLGMILETEIFQQDPDKWFESLDEKTWQNWYSRTDLPAARLVKMGIDAGWGKTHPKPSSFLPELDNKELQDHLSGPDGDQFVACPQWQGKSFETTSLARQSGHPFIAQLIENQGCGIETRLAAKLVELASIKARLGKLALKLSDRGDSKKMACDGEGIGQVEAARGRLVHWMKVEDDTVKAYRILAPTEWNFHPQGAVVQGLQVLPGHDEQALRQMAGLLIETIDPCVGYELTLH